MPSIRQRQRTVLTGLLVLIALAGCAGLSGTESPTPSPADGATQTPLETQTPTVSPSQTTPPTATSPDRFPTGLTESGVRNVTQLVRTHQAAAIETPGVVTHTTNLAGSGLSVVASVRVAAETNLTRVRHVAQSRRTTESETQNSTTVVAANATSVRQYTVAGGNVTLDNRRNRTELFDRALRGLSTATSPLRGMLRRGNFTVTQDTLDDATVITLHADQYAGGQMYPSEDVVAYNATVRVTPDGLVRSATERIVTQRDDGESRYRFAYDFEPRPVNLPSVPQVPEDIRIQSDDPTSN